MKDEHGQAMFLVVFILIALLLVIGLAIDGGRSYQAQRQAHNAADAAAQAGAQELAEIIGVCGNGAGPEDYQVASAIVDFAQNNGVRSDMVNGRVEAWYVDRSQKRLRNVGQGRIPIGATGIEVSLVITQPTSFLRVAGQNFLVVQEDALAMTGPIVQFPNGLIPMAVPFELVTGNAQWPRPAAGERLYLFDNSDGTFCRDAEGTRCFGTGDDRAHRGWLNFDYVYNVDHLDPGDPRYRVRDTNPSASQLRGWVDNGSPVPIFSGTGGYLDGDLIHGFPGAKQSVLDEVVSVYSVSGRVAYVPLFDTVYSGAALSQSGLPAPGVGWPSAGGGADRSWLYHIVGYAAVHPIKLVGNGKHTLEVTFLEAQIAAGEVAVGNGLGQTCQPLVVQGVALWR